MQEVKLRTGKRWRAKLVRKDSSDPRWCYRLWIRSS
jgi:hypothetical protein